MKISIACSSKKLTLSVSPQASVLSLKSLLSAQTQIPAALQLLEIDGTVLLDDRSLADYLSSAKRNVTQRLDLHSQFPLNYRFFPLFGDPFTVPVLINDPLSRVREKVAGALGVESDTVRIAKRGKVLEEGQTVAHWFEPGEFALEILQPEEFFVSVDFGNNALVSMAVAPSLTVTQFFSRLSKLYWIDTTSLCLLYKETKLQFSDTFSSLGIQSNEFLSISSQSAATIMAKSFDRISIEISIAGMQTAKELIRVIERRIGRTTGTLLVSLGRQVTEAESLSSCGILPGSIVEYGEIAVHVRTSNIERTTVVVDSSIRVSALSAILAARLFLPSVSLVYKGVMLSESKPLSDYPITTNIVLEVLQPTDSYVWVKSAPERIRLDIPSFSLSAAELLGLFSSHVPNQKADCVLHSGQLIDLPKSLCDCGIYPGAILELTNTHSSSIVTIFTYQQSCNLAIPKKKTIATLKKKIEKQCRISRDKQRLFNSGKRLKEDQRLSALSTHTFHVLSADELLLTFISTQTCEVHYAIVHSSDTILTVKSYLPHRWRTQTDANPVLVYKERMLEDQFILGDFVRSDKPHLFVGSYTTCYVRVVHGTNTEIVKIPSLDISIAQLQDICDNFLPSNTLLYYKWKKLEKRKTLAEYSVPLGGKVTAIERNKIVITVRDFACRESLYVLSQNSIAYNLMREIQHSTGVSMKCQTLVASGKPLDPHTPLAQLSSEVYLLQNNQRYIYLLDSANCKELFFFDKDETVSSLIGRVGSKIGLQKGEFVLVHEDCKLRPICEAKCGFLRNGDIVELVKNTDHILIITLPLQKVMKRSILPSQSLNEALSHFSLPISTSLVHQQQRLVGTRTIADYALTACSEISALGEFQQLFTVEIAGKGSVNFIHDGYVCDIITTKREVANAIGVAQQSLEIYCQGKLCTDHDSIRHSSSLFALQKCELYIHANSLYHQTASILLKSFQQVADLRSVVASSFKQPAQSIRLLVRNELLDDDSRALMDCKLARIENLTVLYPEDVLISVHSSKSKVAFALKRSDTVKKLKGNAAKMLFISRVAYQGQEMLDENSFDHYRIRNNAVVQRLSLNEKLVTLKNMNGDGFSLIIDNSVLMYSTLTTAVKEKTGVEVEALSCAVVLHKEEAISHYRISEEMQIHLLFTSSSSQLRFFSVGIKHFSQYKGSVQVSRDTTFAEVKKLAEKRIGKKVNQLLIDGKVADGNSMPTSKTIYENSDIYLILEDDCIVTVSPPDQDPFLLPTTSQSTVFTIATSISSITGIKATDQRLFVRDIELSPSDLLCNFGNEFEVVVRPTKEMVIVETVTSEKTSIYCPLSSTIQTLKGLIESQLGVSSTRQRLFYRDIALENENTLESYGAESGAIVMLLRQSDFRLFVKTLLNTGCYVYAANDEKVSSLQRKVAKCCQVHYNDVQLVIDIPRIHEDTFHSISKAGSSLCITVSLQLPSNTVILLLYTGQDEAQWDSALVTADSEVQPLRAFLYESIGSLAQKVAEITKTESVRLGYRGRELSYISTVEECGLESLATLTIIR